jgi:hypothetical protein
MAAFFGLIVAGLSVLVFRPSQTNHPAISFAALLRAGFVVMAFLWLSTSALEQTYLIRAAEGRSSALGYLVGRETDQTLVRQAARVGMTLDLLRNRPFGVGLGGTLGTSELTSPSAAIYWIQAGGAPAAAMLIVLYGTLFFSYCLPALRSSMQVNRHVAAAFLGITVHNLSYGNWMAPFYLFSIAAMVICAEHAKTVRAETLPARHLSARAAAEPAKLQLGQ